MKRILNFIFNRWTIAFLGLAALSLLIWLIGPLIAVGNYRPLESNTARLILIFGVIALYAGKPIWNTIKSKRLNAKLMDALLRHPPPPPGDGAGAEEVATLQKRFEEAVAVLKQANLKEHPRNRLLALLNRGHYVYDLPWYIFIGPPGSGKTTALINSGLQFPFADRLGQEMVRGVGGTRNCDWWFTNEAVLLDTAGRYTTQESNQEADRAAWSGFLALLKKYRPRRPINGVIVTVSTSDLLQQSAADRMAQAHAIRSRVQELYEQLKIRFPVYVLVTKADLLAGFMEFFGEFGREERAQVWGSTFPLSEKQELPPLQGYSAEFEGLEQRLNDKLIDRLQQERDVQRRALLYAFPQQFHILQQILGDFLNEVFSPSRFEQRPLLRGFYFTSGTQEGNPIDRVMGAWGRALNLEHKLLTPHRPSGKTFFLNRLLKNVIFAEAALAGTNLNWESRRVALQWAIYGMTGIITISVVTAWAVSYSNNKRYVAEVQEKIPTVLEEVEGLSTLQDMNVVRLLPVLASVKELAGAASSEGDAPLSMGFGLYQGEKLGEAANNSYHRLLRDVFLPQLILRIENLLSTSGRVNPELLYEGLKAYLMLHDRQHFSPMALKAFITAEWDMHLPREVTIEQRQQLESHLDDLLARGSLTSPIPMNEKLVDNVRQTVARIPIAERIYNRIKQLGTGDELPEFTIAKAAGPAAPLVFSRVSGQPLTKGVPGLFSYIGYHKAFAGATREVTRQLAEEEVWVLGLKGTERDRWRSPQTQARLLDEVQRLYLEDYAARWSAFINDIRLVQADSLQKSVQMARLLSTGDSPLILLTRAIVKEVTLADTDESEKTITDKAADKVKTAREKLETLFGQTSREAHAASIESRPEAIVDERFRELRRLVRPVAPGQPAPIDTVPAQVNELYTLLTATEAALKSGSTPPPSDVPTKIKADAGRMPEPVRSVLISLSAGGVSQALGATRANLHQSLSASIGEFCNKAITGRYPFVKDSKLDVTQDDFARLFAPGGLLDEFFQKNLAQHVDTSTRPWSFRNVGDASISNAPAALQEFQRAQVIRDVFFRSGGRTPGMSLTFKPLQMDDSISQFILDIDGQLVKYSHGPQVPMTLQWPGPRGSSQVRLQVSPASTRGASGQVFEGPWALFRMLDGAKMDQSSQPEKFVVSFNPDGRAARFEVVTSSVQNPFRLNELRQFNCPGRL
jgi:type VI secretion system protein ImpL